MKPKPQKKKKKVVGSNVPVVIETNTLPPVIVINVRDLEPGKFFMHEGKRLKKIRHNPTVAEEEDSGDVRFFPRKCQVIRA